MEVGLYTRHYLCATGPHLTNLLSRRWQRAYRPSSTCFRLHLWYLWTTGACVPAERLPVVWWRWRCGCAGNARE